MSKHQLYYSKRCRFCQAFLEELARTPYTREFVLICVDPSPSRPSLPGWLKSVPSLLVAGESTPRVGPGPVNNWLFERKQGGAGAAPKERAHPAAVLEERRAPHAPPEYNPNIAPRPDASARSGAGPRPSALPPAISGATKADSSMGPPTLAMSEDGPLGFHSTEMGGSKLSDSYSFIQTNFASDKGYNPILKNFESLVAQPTLEGFAGAGGGAARPPAVKVSAKEAKLLSDFEAFSAARDRDIPGPLRRQ